MCVNYSDDAFLSKDSKTVAYNSNKPQSRVRFSLMHELGHHVLEHKSDSPQNEQEANCFASNILAPRIVMYYAKCQNALDVRKIFGLSSEASEYAFNDYCRWKDNVFANKRKISRLDKRLYDHFYHPTTQTFVWRAKGCAKCHKNTIYNSFDSICDQCKRPSNLCDLNEELNRYLMNKCLRPRPEEDINFLFAESRKIYGYEAGSIFTFRSQNYRED